MSQLVAGAAPRNCHVVPATSFSVTACWVTDRTPQPAKIRPSRPIANRRTTDNSSRGGRINHRGGHNSTIWHFGAVRSEAAAILVSREPLFAFRLFKCQLLRCDPHSPSRNVAHNHPLPWHFLHGSPVSRFFPVPAQRRHWQVMDSMSQLSPFARNRYRNLT